MPDDVEERQVAVMKTARVVEPNKSLEEDGALSECCSARRTGARELKVCGWLGAWTDDVEAKNGTSGVQTK